MKNTTRRINKFEYHLSDLGCEYCVNCLPGYRKGYGNGCGNDLCEFEDIKQDCVANGRIERPKGWDMAWEE